jgi:CRP/FNR family transcriptional regulator, anaerobic regulatory protein
MPGTPVQSAMRSGRPLASAPGSFIHEVLPSASRYSAWNLAEFCLSVGLDAVATPRIARLLAKRIRYRKGDILFRVGDGFNSLHAIHMGSCKTALLAKDGQDQIAGYHIAGEIIGMDGIGTNIHDCQATALEDMETCPLPFDQIEDIARHSNRFQHNLNQLLSRECTRARTMMIVLGKMNAEQRLAVFLLDLSQRYREHGYSSCEFVLRMTREEIGSYLGLQLETVSRLFSRFHHDGLIQVQGRAIKLLDRVAVSRLVDGSDPCDGVIAMASAAGHKRPMNQPGNTERRMAGTKQSKPAPSASLPDVAGAASSEGALMKRNCTTRR